MYSTRSFQPLQRGRSCRKSVARHHMRGVTLVGLMIGLLISMFVVVGMLTVFRTVVGATVQARQDSGEGDRRVSSFMRVALQVQDAGFGINNPIYGKQLLVLQDVSLGQDNVGLSGTPGTGTNNSGNAVLWAIDSGTGTVQLQCAGFLYKAADDASQLLYLPPVSCAGDMTDLATLTWAPQVWLQGSKAHPVPSMHFESSAGDCSPFGIVDTHGGLSLSAFSVRGDDVDNPVESRQCLLNFPLPASNPAA